MESISLSFFLKISFKFVIERSIFYFLNQLSNIVIPRKCMNNDIRATLWIDCLYKNGMESRPLQLYICR